MNLDFLATFGTIVLFVIVIALLAQLPIITWLIAIPLFIIIGIKNAK